MNNKIALIGCGWLGLPLAKSLLTKGYQVAGSTTSVEKLSQLRGNGISPFLITLSEEGIDGNIETLLNNAAAVIVNVPPKLRGGSLENYVAKMSFLNAAILEAKIPKVIFVSSTSVYGDASGDVTEETPTLPSTESGKQLLLSENIFREEKNYETTVIRFGGLIGPNRHPVTMLSKRKNLKNGHHPINLIHLTDCIRVIEEILQQGWWNMIFNAVYPYHPSKEDYYTGEAERRNLQKPDYEPSKKEEGKTIISYNLITVKGFEFTTTL